MTPRQARTERRAAERKAKKAGIRRNKQIALELDENLSLEEEFSPEELARGRAAAARIEGEVALKMAARDAAANQSPDQNPDCEGGAANPGFVSQLPVPVTQSQQFRPLPLEPLSPNDHARLNRLKAEYKAQANRLNAQHSTGPRTPVGKSTSSRNAIKHGLASGELIIAGEDASVFEDLLAALLDEHHPEGATEELLINEMAQSHWLAQRALRLQNECFTDEGVDDKRLSLYMRYHTTHQRAFHKALTALMKLKKEQTRGFVSQIAQRTEKSGFVKQNPYQNPNREGGAAPKSEFVPQKHRAEAA